MDLLQPTDVARIERVFTCFSKHVELSDGSTVDGVTVEELRAVLHTLGLHPTDAQLHEIVSRCDTQGRGFLDSAEFVQLLCGELGDFDHETELVEVFNDADTDKDGFLECPDIAAAIAASAVPGTSSASEVPLTMADIDAVLLEAAGPEAKGMSMHQFNTLMRQQR